MKVLKDLLAAFALYSRIPMPRVRFEEGEGSGAILFLPFVGAVIGGLTFGMIRLNLILNLPVFVLMILLTVIPLIVTGGFHMDGFLDVEDALSSFHDKEKSLQILKDPHIGAFAVIRFAVFALLWLGALYLLIFDSAKTGELTGLYQYAVCFVLARSFCGLTSLTSKKARPDGMLARETKGPGKGGIVFLALQAVAASVFLILFCPLSGVFVLAGIVIFTLYYASLCKKRFGGVTGDTAGFYVAVSELVCLLILAVYSLWQVL